MLADPSHAARGVSSSQDRGDTGAAPVGRLLRNQRAALPSSGNTPAASPPAGAPAAPGGTNGR